MIYDLFILNLGWGNMGANDWTVLDPAIVSGQLSDHNQSQQNGPMGHTQKGMQMMYFFVPLVRSLVPSAICENAIEMQSTCQNFFQSKNVKKSKWLNQLAPALVCSDNRLEWPTCLDCLLFSNVFMDYLEIYESA